MKTDAVLSECRTWRYSLTRVWDETLPRLNVIGLNPSTADETQDDPTIRRCIGFAKAWGYGSLEMTNLYALRATDPKDMLAAAASGFDVVGPDNGAALWEAGARAGKIVAAWGVHAAPSRSAFVLGKTLGAYDVYCLGKTKEGRPKHPLYLRADTQPELLRAAK